MRNTELRFLYALPEWLRENKESLPSTNLEEISEAQLGRMSQLKTPNQVIAVFKKFETTVPVTKGRLSLVLDAVQDPGNLGTIIRTADWFGISQIICSPECADMYNSKVVQATMGSIARVGIFYTELADWLKNQQPIPIYATLLEGRDVTKMNAVGEGLLIIGNESKGIRSDLVRFATEKITIPRKGKAESLNAAVAAGIILSYLA